MPDAASVRSLCAAWRASATDGGGIQIGYQSEQHRLHRNEVRMHELDYDGVRAALVGLTEILLLPGLNTVVDLDHQLLWSWCGELLLGSRSGITLDREIRGLAEIAVRAALAGARPHTLEAFESGRQASELLDANSNELLQRSHALLPYLAFPLLEAMARRACSSHIDLRGTVLEPFPRVDGRMYRVGRRCSNVADVLRLLVSTRAGESLHDDLIEVLDHVAQFGDASADGYDVLFDWRNSSLHGEVSHATIGGTVLSVALLVALDSLRGDYESHRRAALECVVREVETSRFTGRWRPSPWSYYPPFP